MAAAAAGAAAWAAAQAVRAGAGAARAAVGRVLTAARIPAAAARVARHFQCQDIPAAAALSLSASVCSKCDQAPENQSSPMSLLQLSVAGFQLSYQLSVAGFQLSGFREAMIAPYMAKPRKTRKPRGKRPQFRVRSALFRGLILFA
jgi:hypothetical protein